MTPDAANRHPSALLLPSIATPAFRLVLRSRLVPLAMAMLSACGDGGVVSPAPPPAITSVTVSPTTVSLQGIGTTAQASASYAPSAATGTITWTTANALIATVSGNGGSATITAIAGGSTSIIATAGGISGTTAVTVTPIVSAIVPSRTTAAVAVGATTSLTATLTADAGASTALTWSSSAMTIATVNASGTVTGIAPGVSAITVASTAFPSINATIVVTVSFPVVRSVTVTPANPVVFAGATRQLAAAVDADAGTPQTVNWLSATPTVAQVNASGLVTAVAPGTSVIRATSTVNPNVSGTTTVTVTAPTVRTITLSPESPSSVVASTRQFAVVVDADAGANQAVGWSSSNTVVASISAGGLVTALAPGTTIIKATSVLVPAIAAQTTLTVTSRPVVNFWTPATLPQAKTDAGFLVSKLWSLNSSLAFAIGLPNASKSVMRWNGNTWAYQELAPFDLVSALGGVGGDVYIGNYSGRIARLDQTNPANPRFTELSVPSVGRIFEIVGAGESAVVALAGVAGSFTGSMVLVAQNGVWSRITDPTTVTLNSHAIAASSPTNIYVVGAAGPLAAIARWNGAVWSPVPAPPIALPLFKAGINGTDLIVANSLESARWNGSAWVALTVPSPNPDAGGEWFNRFVRCGGQLYAGMGRSGRVYALNGTQWTVSASYGVALPSSPEHFVGCGADDVLRVGGNDGSISRRTGINWIWETFTPNLVATAVVRSDLAYASGASGLVERWDGTRWQIDLNAPSYDSQLGALSASSDGLVIAGGGALRGVWRRTASSWVFDSLPKQVSAVWAFSSTYALAYRFNGPNAASRFNGTSWQTIDTPPTLSCSALDGVATNFAIVVGSETGNSLAAYLWNGTTFTRMPVPASPNPAESFLGSVDVVSTTLAYASTSSRVLRWDGTSWTYLPAPPVAFPDLIEKVVATGVNEVYLLSRSGLLYYLDGATWIQLATLPTSPWAEQPRWNDFAITPQGFGVAVGSGGSIYHGAVGASFLNRSVRR